MNYIAIGKMINTHGIQGEIKIESWSDFDEERYQKGNTIYFFHEGSYVPFHISTYRKQKGFVFVKFQEIKNINEVELYKNDILYVEETSRKKLQDGEYYRTDLVHLKAIDEEGIDLGIVIAVEETKGAQNNLRIQKQDGTEFLVPYVPMFIKNVDLEKKTILIHVVEGLL